MSVFCAPSIFDIKRKFINLSRNRVLDRAAILAFYFLIAIFPLIYFFGILISIGGEPNRGFLGTVLRDLEQVLPRAASLLITDTLREIINSRQNVALSLVLPWTWWSVCQGMLAIIDGINRTFGIVDSRSWWKRYLLASVMTLLFVFLFAAAVVLLSSASKLMKNLLPQVANVRIPDWSWIIFVWAVVFLFVLIAFNCLYRYSPNRASGRWRWLMPGTLVATILFLATSMGLKSYLHNFTTLQATYGSATAEIVLLLWLYFSGLAILVGAEINEGYIRTSPAFRNGSPGG